jgi:rod shape-determining protein MreD
MVKDLFLYGFLGLILLVLQSTLLSVEAIDPLGPDLIFILLIFLGTLERLGMGLILSLFLGLMVDLLSWGVPGTAMILYPLIFWIFFFVGTRTDIQSSAFAVIAVLLFQIFYGFLVHFFLAIFRGLEFTRVQLFLVIEQAFITMLVSLPVLFIFKVFFGKKPSLR